MFLSYRRRVFAANEIEILILVLVRLRFDVNEIGTAAIFLVSEAVKEIMLIIDWQTELSRQWQFNNKTQLVDGFR